MNENLTVTVATEVRAEMARQRVTQQQIADVLGISQPQVSMRLRAEIPFGVDELGMVADALGVPVTNFLATAAQASA